LKIFFNKPFTFKNITGFYVEKLSKKKSLPVLEGIILMEE